jgi:two-component system, chemotaxis family, sensor kinase Cph1
MERSISDREFSQFLLRACHDLKTAARAVRTHSELFLKDADQPAMEGFAQRLGFVIDGARKMDSLLDSLVSYAVALETDPATFQSTRTDVLLRFVLARMEQDLHAAGADVAYSDLPAVTGNPDRLMEVFENLLRNTLVHRGEAPPRIQIAGSKQEGEWLFRVRDNGPGVEAEFLERIFLPFERLSRQRPGAGLGLAICRAIVERHGGRIWAESPADGGALFCFTLPAK